MAWRRSRFFIVEVFPRSDVRGECSRVGSVALGSFFFWEEAELFIGCLNSLAVRLAVMQKYLKTQD